MSERFLLSLMCLAVSSYALEEEARDYINSVHIEDDQVDNYSQHPIDSYSHPEHPVDDYNIPDHPVDSYSHSEQQQEQDLEVESSVDEPAVEESSASHQQVANTVQEPLASSVEEPVGEPPKKTYASIVCSLLVILACACVCLSFVHVYAKLCMCWFLLKDEPTMTIHLD